MTEKQKRQTIEKYIQSYNAFDIDAIISTLHPDVNFKNITDGRVNASTS